LKACSDFAIRLESIFQQEKILSMKQKYQMKIAPGTVVFQQVETVPILE
jgi:hypothetical protein